MSIIKEKHDLDYHCRDCNKDFKINPASTSTNVLCPGCQNPMDLINEGIIVDNGSNAQIDDFKKNATRSNK